MDGYCMIRYTVEVEYIQAEKGKVLTNGEVYVPSNRKVALGVNDAPENWHEITEGEYNAILEEQSEKIEEYIEPLGL